MFELILQAALIWGPKAGLEIAAIWKKSHSLTAEQAVDELSGVLIEINAKTVDGAVAEAEARAAGQP